MSDITLTIPSIFSEPSAMLWIAATTRVTASVPTRAFSIDSIPAAATLSSFSTTVFIAP